MKRVLISVSNDLSTDQRVAKVCQTFVEEGYEVLLLGRLKKNSRPLNRPYPTKRFSMLFHSGFLFYAEFNLRLFFFLLFTKKDLLYANDADTLLPNYWMSKLQSKPLIFDSHELFSEVPELLHKPFVKNVWRRIERSIIPKLKSIITVSEGIKNYYLEQYNCNAQVIRNVPIAKKTYPARFPFSTKNKKIILSQGSVNMGRGLELMIETMPLLPEYLLVVIGDGDILQELEEKVLTLNLEYRVKFLGKLSPKKLKDLTPLADIGISLEEDLGLNYRYALPNKLFDYIQAEIPVLVSDLPEMSALVTQYQVGEVLQERRPQTLATTILEIADKNYDAYLTAAKNELTWQREKSILIKLIKTIE